MNSCGREMHWIVLSTVLLISNHDYEVQWPPDHVQRCQSLLDGAVDDEKEKILPSSLSLK